MQRLNRKALQQLPASIAQPDYHLDASAAGIVHLGIGAFHRAHQAVFTDALLNLHGGDWRIIGVSLRSDTVYDQLAAQDGLYSVLSRDAEQQELRVIGSVAQVLRAHRELDAVIDAIAAPAIHIITLTITEKGYCQTDDGSLDLANPDISHDLANPDQPRTAVGVLALGLQRRFERGGQAITVISCDNLAENGRVMAAVLRDYVQRCFPGLLDWLAEHVAFPCSMVDRIVPAISEGQRMAQCEQLGFDDASAIATEPFMQWIIEDDFHSDRPGWEEVGVQMVADIRPYERMKLQLLNASHSAIAYLGLLANKETVDQVMATPWLGDYIARLMADELLPALQVPRGFDVAAYAQQLQQRFSNPYLQHRCAQIAMDGSEKIRQRWLPRLQTAQPSPLLVKALAAWCAVVLLSGHELHDPRADELLQWRASDAGLSTRVQQVLALAGINSSSCPGISELLAMVMDDMNCLAAQGVQVMLTGKQVRQ